MKIAVIAMAFVASAAFASSTTTGTPAAAPAPATKEASKKDHAAHTAPAAAKDAKHAECKEKNADGTCKDAAKK